MTSSDESAGRELLQTWKRTSRPIRVQFSSSGETFAMDGRGRITELDTEALSIEGEGFGLLLSLTGARFKSVGSAERILEVGLDPSRYSETIELLLGDMERLVLAALPETNKGKPN